MAIQIFIDDNAATGDADKRKGIRVCTKMDKYITIQPTQNGLEKTKYMTIITGRHKNKHVEEEAKEGKIVEADTYWYLGVLLNKEADLKKPQKETDNKANGIIREINGISSKQNVGPQEIRVKIKLVQTCLIPAVLYGSEV